MFTVDARGGEIISYYETMLKGAIFRGSHIAELLKRS